MKAEQERSNLATLGKTEIWRLTDIASMEVLKAWLSGHQLDVIHDEPTIDGSGTYQHPGYHVTACLVCHRSTIAGNGRLEATCGRHTCEVPILATPEGALEQ